ncbi:putative sodium-coupled neutral amino acid transporter 7 [Scyliorhinus canicula]|uniref:putative sodium-coupled neutral amino acid transporter 7 n=1 Tax=Scyliorhinus canicula TaxID=7830 RepID=UPI0018F63C0E|nr:putative sodium-coupled neutral amino acid transporter 7 [Scyliorhinus canicula]
MAFCEVTVNNDRRDWSWTEEAGEKTSLLQNPLTTERPRVNRKREGSTSAFGAVFIVVNAALGAGLLNFPYAFFVAGGVVSGIILLLCLVLFIIAGLVILAYCSQVSNKATYQEVVRAACGQVVGTICDVLIAVYTFGTCIAFLIIIGDQLDMIIGAFMHTPKGDTSAKGHWYSDRKFTISVTSILVILPLSIPKEIGFQKYASTLSVLGTWYVTIVVIIKYIWPDQGIIVGEIPTHRTVIEGLWLRFKGEDVDMSLERRRRILQTLIWFFLTLVLALFIPDIGKVISVIGGLAACFILVFPGLCLIEAKFAEIQQVGSASWWTLVLCGILMMCMGVFIFGQSTANSIYQDLHN